MNTHLLEEELAPLNAQIDDVRKKQGAFKEELLAVEEELETFAAERQKYDALKNVCDALDTLKELGADDLFWEGLSDSENAARHVEQTRGRIAVLEEEVVKVLDRQKAVQEKIEKCGNELGILYDEISEVLEREEQRKDAYVIEREVSKVPYRKMIMPWTKESESEKNYRRAVLVALVPLAVLRMLKFPG